MRSKFIYQSLTQSSSLVDVINPTKVSPEDLTWVIDKLGVKKLRYTGNLQRVGILDTGCDVLNPLLKDNVSMSIFLSHNNDSPPWIDCDGHGCINGDALIATDNKLVPIADLYDQLDVVEGTVSETYTPYGTYRLNVKYVPRDKGISVLSYVDGFFESSNVRMLHKLQYDKLECYKVKTDYGDLILTPWHPLYVIHRDVLKLALFEPIMPARVTADNLSMESHLIYTPGGGLINYKRKNCTYLTFGDNGINKQLCQLIGLLHGIKYNNKIRISFEANYIRIEFDASYSLNSINAILNLIKFVGSSFNFVVTDGTSPLSYHIRPTIVSIDTIKELFYKLQEVDVAYKILTEDVLSHVLAFFGGMLSGMLRATLDGTFVKDMSITIPDEICAKGIDKLVMSLSNFGFSVVRDNNSVKVDWCLEMSQNSLNELLQNNIYGLESKYRPIYTEIKSIEKIEYTGPLYDLTVDESHNYCANGCIVSNTMVTSIIVGAPSENGFQGVAPQAKAVHARVFYGDIRDSIYNEHEYHIANAIKYLVSLGCKVINMSFGTVTPSDMLADAIKYAYNSGVILVASVGNNKLTSNTVLYPAAYPEVIGVGAANSDSMPAWFSASGGKDPYTGVEVAVACPDFVYGLLPGGHIGKCIGTSFTAPYISGLALLWLEAMQNKLTNTSADVEKFREWLRILAVDTNKNGWDPELGFGVVECKCADLSLNTIVK